jgi:type IV secretory pathway TrbL component
MNSQAIFIFKILLLSTGLSLLVKYGGGYLELQPTTITALTIVLMPSLVLGLILGWRYYQTSDLN